MSAPATKQRRSGSDPSCRHPINIPLTQRFLSWIHRPELGGCFELRAPHARVHYRTNAIVAADSIHATVGGWYDNVDDSRHDLSRVEDVSIYACFNPIDAALCGRKKNKIGPITKATKDEHIIKWIRFYLDFDSVRIEGISATDDELAGAMDKFHVMLDNEPELAAAAHWGCSGNGMWGGVDFEPLDVAIAEPLVERALCYLAARYSVPLVVKVGTECKNASRIGCVPGTWKCKGEDLEGKRPWRQVTMDSPDEPRTPLVLPEWLADRHVPEVTPNGRVRSQKGRISVPEMAEPSANGHKDQPNGDTHPDYSGDVPIEDRLKRAKAYLATKDISVQGDNGSARIRSACHDILWGFGLTVDQARPMFQEWNKGCKPAWEDSKLEYSMGRGYSIPDKQGRPRGYKLDERGANLPDIADQVNQTYEDTDDVKADGGNGQAPVNEAPDDPHRLARVYITRKCSHKDADTLRFYRDAWMKWNGHYYKEVPTKEINAYLSKMTKAEFDAWNKIEIDQWRMRGRKNLAGKQCPMPEVRRVGTRTIGDVSQAVTSYVVLNGEIEAPTWLDRRVAPDPIEVLPCKNGLIHLPSYVSGDGYFWEPTPLFFGTYSLGYDFDCSAPDPIEWLKFLDSIWGNDKQSISTLQEWFGYCLTPDNRQHKMLMLIGPKRAGKDTIGNILQSLIGDDNSTGNTLNSFSDRFGITAMIGKPLTVISDARISGRGDLAVIVERLLTISGGGKLTIDRKNMTAWNGTLKTRIMINTNELPRFMDSSGAFASRLLILRLQKSFYGNEDIGLFARLQNELPGILLWSIKGWDRLNKRGKFEQPDSATEMVAEMRELSSPMGAFIEEVCFVGEEHRVAVKSLYGKWCNWCNDSGRHPGTPQMFGRDLRACIPQIEVERPGSDPNVREREYIGIGLYDIKAAKENRFTE